MSIAGRLSYDDILGNHYDEPFLIDLGVYGPAFQAEKDIPDLVAEVKALRTEVGKWTAGNRGLLVSARSYRRYEIVSERPFHFWKVHEAGRADGWRGVVCGTTSVCGVDVAGGMYPDLRVGS
jgi:hypothetical protein